MVQRRIDTHSLKNGRKTKYWVGVSGKLTQVSEDTVKRFSPNGANTMSIPEEELKGKSILDISNVVKSFGFRICRVGKVKLWYEKVESQIVQSLFLIRGQFFNKVYKKGAPSWKRLFSLYKPIYFKYFSTVALSDSYGNAPGISSFALPSTTTNVPGVPVTPAAPPAEA